MTSSLNLTSYSYHSVNTLTKKPLLPCPMPGFWTLRTNQPYKVNGAWMMRAFVKLLNVASVRLCCDAPLATK